MFKKLKEKITEEVKSSPQRFAEFTQTVSDRLQSTSTPDDSLFSIGENDLNNSVSSDSNHGFSSVQLVSPSQDSRTRRNSGGSVASDISFLPRYESSAAYHLQSDLDISASEIEDNASTASSQLGHLNKEQIYSAFQKAQMRYHKYRGRYTDLARHYKDLERENMKMKAVLVETQDKAIRRVTELKEQCNLEQKAKAHLESALRDEIDEKNYKINTLHTKIELLQKDNNSDTLINVEDNSSQIEKLENLTKYLTEARKEIENLNEKNQELKAGVIVFQSKEQEYKTKLANLEKEISIIAEREKENNLKLAQDKMELHNEILNKDSEITTLKRENELYKQNAASLESETKMNTNSKLENLQSQNKKLIEKLETLSHRSNYLENELLKIESYKLEIEDLQQKQQNDSIAMLELKKINEQISDDKNKLILEVQAISEDREKIREDFKKENDSLESQISNLREDAKQGLLSLEPKIRDKLQLQYNQREEELKREFATKLEELSFNNSSLKEIKLQLLLKDDLIENVSEELERTKNDLSKKIEDYNNLEKNHLELIEDSSKLQNKISNLEKEKTSLETYTDKISRLEAHINTLQEELKETKAISDRKEKENMVLSQETFNLQQQIQSVSEKMDMLEEQSEAKNIEYAEVKLLQKNLNNLEEEKKAVINEFEMEIAQLKETLQKERETNEAQTMSIKSYRDELQGEISHYKDLLSSEQVKTTKLQEHSLICEQQIVNLKESVKMWEEKDKIFNLDKTESDLLKLKLQEIEEKNNKLSLSSHEAEENFAKQLESFKIELCKNNAQLSSGNEVDFKDIIAHIKEINKSKEDEIIYLSKENTTLSEEVFKWQEKVRLLEETIEKIEVLKSENKLLELKVQNLEDENKKLITEIETEKKTSSTLLENSKELQEKQVIIEQLESKLSSMDTEISAFQKTVSKQETEKTQLMEEKLNLETGIAKLEETVRLFEENEKVINFDKTESGLLRIKIQNLEEEKQKILASFEEERTSFSQSYEQHVKDAKEAKHLSEENEQLNSEIQKLNASVTQYSSSKNESDQTLNKLSNNLEELRIENEKLTMELTYAAKTNHSNSEEIGRLIAEMINLEKDLQDKVENIAKLKKRTITIEEEKSLLEQKLEHSKNLMSEKNTQVEAVQQDNSNFREKCNVLHNDLTNLHTEIENLNQEMNTLREQSFTATDYKSKFHLKENENQNLASQIEAANKEISELNNRIQQITSDNHNVLEECQSLMREKEELQFKLEMVSGNTQEIMSQTKNAHESSNNNIQADFYDIKQKCDNMLVENKGLKTENTKLLEKCKKFDNTQQSLEVQIRDLENQYGEILIEKQLLQDEIQELRISHVNQSNSAQFSKLDHLNILRKEQTLNEDPEKETYLREIETLRDKVTKYKSLDITNKSSIEFYENELEKLKKQNDKLNRKLDETLVTLNHCTELSNSSTEIEYLKNVLYNYMLGKESVTLARVIAAVCKFDQQQTETVLQREQHKQTLLGQLGLI